MLNKRKDYLIYAKVIAGPATETFSPPNNGDRRFAQIDGTYSQTYPTAVGSQLPGEPKVFHISSITNNQSLILIFI